MDLVSDAFQATDSINNWNYDARKIIPTKDNHLS